MLDDEAVSRYLEVRPDAKIVVVPDAPHDVFRPNQLCFRGRWLPSWTASTRSAGGSARRATARAHNSSRKRSVDDPTADAQVRKRQARCHRREGIRPEAGAC